MRLREAAASFRESKGKPWGGGGGQGRTNHSSLTGAKSPNAATTAKGVLGGHGCEGKGPARPKRAGASVACGRLSQGPECRTVSQTLDSSRETAEGPSEKERSHPRAQGLSLHWPQQRRQAGGGACWCPLCTVPTVPASGAARPPRLCHLNRESACSPVCWTILSEEGSSDYVPVQGMSSGRNGLCQSLQGHATRGRACHQCVPLREMQRQLQAAHVTTPENAILSPPKWTPGGWQ